MFFWIVFALVFLFALSSAYAGLKGAPWVPTWKKDIDRIARLLDLQEGDRFIELGSGTGRVCQALAKKSKAHIFGIELSLVQWLIAVCSSRGVRFFFGDVFHHDLSSYNAIYLFLMPETYAKLRLKFERELKPGTKVVTYVWPMPEWTPVTIDRSEGQPVLYLYEK